MKHIFVILCVSVLGYFNQGILAIEETKEIDNVTRILTTAEAEMEETSRDEIPDKQIEQYKKNIEQVLNISENSIVTSVQDSSDLDTWVAPYDIRKHYPYYLSGYDDESRPIWVAEIGSWNLRRIVEEGGQKFKDFDKYVQQAAHRAVKSLQDRSNTDDEQVTDAVLLVDMDKLDIIQMAHIPTVSYVLQLAREYQNLVANHIHIGIAVNTNAVAQTLLNLVRPVFGRIFSKIEIYGTNKANFIPHILKHCPSSQIAPWYGGSKDFSPVRVYG